MKEITLKKIRSRIIGWPFFWYAVIFPVLISLPSLAEVLEPTNMITAGIGVVVIFLCVFILTLLVLDFNNPRLEQFEGIASKRVNRSKNTNFRNYVFYHTLTVYDEKSGESKNFSIRDDQNKITINKKVRVYYTRYLRIVIDIERP